MATHKGKDYTVTYKDDEETRDRVFKRLLSYYHRNESYSGECIMQSDDPQIEAAPLLSDIADEVICFDCRWDDQV